MPGQVAVYVCVQPPKNGWLWRKKNIFHVPFPASVTSRDRFTAITSNLHMSDPEEDAINDQKKGDRRLWPPCKRSNLSSIWSETAAGTFIKPKRHIWVDERMVGTKARIKIKQYMKAKPTKWGLKFYVLADVNSWLQPAHRGDPQGVSGRGLYTIYTLALSCSVIWASRVLGHVALTSRAELVSQQLRRMATCSL